MHLNPIFSLNKLRVKTSIDPPTSLSTTSSPCMALTSKSSGSKPVLLRQNNLALNLSKKPESLPKPLVRKKSRPKTLSAALNGPMGKICFTDFFSENMKREFVKMGRLDVLATFAMSNNIKPAQQADSINPVPSDNEFKNKLLLRETRSRVKSEYRKGRSVICRKDMRQLMGICDNTRVENDKLKKSISKTALVLKDQYLSLLRSSSCKAAWKEL